MCSVECPILYGAAVFCVESTPSIPCGPIEDSRLRYPISKSFQFVLQGFDIGAFISKRKIAI